MNGEPDDERGTEGCLTLAALVVASWVVLAAVARLLLG